MQTWISQRLAFPFAAIALSATGANAQERVPADPDPTRLANAPHNPDPEDDWRLQIGGGLFYGPAFLGAKDYHFAAARTSRSATRTASSSR